MFCLFACWIQSHVCIERSNFCRRALAIQSFSQFISRWWRRLYFVSCPTPLCFPCKTQALLQQKDREGQTDEGRTGWTLSHPARCPCTGLLLHHHHKHGTTRQCPSCPSTCKPHHSLRRNLSIAIASLSKERCREDGAMSQAPYSPSHLYHILAGCAIQWYVTIHKLLLLQWHKKTHHAWRSHWQNNVFLWAWKHWNIKISMADSCFRAEQRHTCTAHLLAGIPWVAEAAQSFRWDAVMRSQLGETGSLRHASTLSAANLKPRKFLFSCTNASVGLGNSLPQDTEVSSSGGFPNGLGICKQQTSPGKCKD